MLVQLPPAAAQRYRGWLDLYERITGKFATYKERTEAFFAAIENTKPWWA